jgi:hypothetical protein
MGEINPADGSDYHQDQHGGKERVNDQSNLLKTPKTGAN